MFSARLPPRLSPNRVSLAIDAARRSGRRLLDLTETNPTVVGFDYPSTVTTALADPRGLRYAPEPFGLDQARQAIAASTGWGPADQLVLTSSTSEAYSLLFKLLADPGDEVLVPRPSYPLFELLTRLDNVVERPYQLDRDRGWAIDRPSVEHGLSGRTRAVLVVSPNNPTGSCLWADDREWLVGLARARDLALISDEVFADYPLVPRSDRTSLAGESRVLTFTLGGLSKAAGLPQMKLAWTLVSGPSPIVADALDRLSLIADSYLSVSTPVQVAASTLLAEAAPIRSAIRSRVMRNWQALAAAARVVPSLTVYAPEGGWSAVFRVPAILSADELVLRLLDERGVIVHPGYFFDLEGEGFLVTSLLPRPDVFDEAMRAVCALVAEAAS